MFYLRKFAILVRDRNDCLEESLSECRSNETSSDIDGLLNALNSSERRVDFLKIAKYVSSQVWRETRKCQSLTMTSRETSRPVSAIAVSRRRGRHQFHI